MAADMEVDKVADMATEKNEAPILARRRRVPNLTGRRKHRKIAKQP